MGATGGVCDVVSGIHFLQRTATWDLPHVAWVAAAGAVLGMAGIAFMLNGGNELYLFFFRSCSAVSSMVTCPTTPTGRSGRWQPYPQGLEWPFYVLVAAVGGLALCKDIKANPLMIVLAFPMFGDLWLGQVDLGLAVGIRLALLSRNAYVRGFGIALAAVKPQVTWLVILAFRMIPLIRGMRQTPATV